MSGIDWLVDVVIAAGAFGFGMIQLMLSVNLFVPDDFTRRILGIHSVAPSAFAIFATAAISLPLVVRRRMPWVVLISTLALWLAYERIADIGTSTVSPLVALFTVAYDRGRHEAAVASLLTLVVTLLPSTEGYRSGLNSLLLFQNAAFAIAVGLAGYALNARQLLMESAQARAAAAERLSASETKRAIEAERTRESEASRRVEEERVRIAREVHDITAHSLSAVSIQAAAAERLLDVDPAAAREAIAEVRSTAKDALAEMRSMVGVLRDGEGERLHPTAGTEQIGELVGYLERAGLRCSLDDGAYDPARVPKHIDIALFGIAREACTNIVRHANANRASIRLLLSDGSAHLEVRDDGCGISLLSNLGGCAYSVAPTGHGIEGMRERVKLLGGEFDVESDGCGGTCIKASISVCERMD